MGSLVTDHTQRCSLQLERITGGSKALLVTKRSFWQLKGIASSSKALLAA
jgi:hypothetical protein